MIENILHVTCARLDIDISDGAMDWAKNILRSLLAIRSTIADESAAFYLFCDPTENMLHKIRENPSPGSLQECEEVEIDTMARIARGLRLAEMYPKPTTVRGRNGSRVLPASRLLIDSGLAFRFGRSGKKGRSDGGVADLFRGKLVPDLFHSENRDCDAEGASTGNSHCRLGLKDIFTRK